MCIRDRPEAVQEVKPKKQEETTETDTVSTEQPQTVSETGQAAQPAEQPDKADKTEHSVSTSPVSYTHLDVYKRQILSGIHSFYEPEELVGKTCIAITNLPPRPMMGLSLIHI